MIKTLYSKIVCSNRTRHNESQNTDGSFLNVNNPPWKKYPLSEVTCLKLYRETGLSAWEVAERREKWIEQSAKRDVHFPTFLPFLWGLSKVHNLIRVKHGTSLPVRLVKQWFTSRTVGEVHIISET